jgi:hypothetical protein
MYLSERHYLCYPKDMNRYHSRYALNIESGYSQEEDEEDEIIDKSNGHNKIFRQLTIVYPLLGYFFIHRVECIYETMCLNM